MFECWALGKPIVMAAGRNTEERTVLEESGGGIAVDPGDIDSMAKALLKMKHNANLASDYGKKGLNAVRDKFNRETAIDNLASCIKNLETSEKVR
jgi:glycosyltransferase involved in cell wall biosynthesis